MKKGFTEEQIAFVIHRKEVSKRSFSDIVGSYNKKFDSDLSEDDIKLCYEKYKNIFKMEDNHVKTLKSIHSTKKSNSYTAKENRAIINEWNKRDSILEAVDSCVNRIALTKYKVKNIKRSKKKKSMTLELLFSDVHYGKFIDNVEGNFVDSNEIRARVRRIAASVLKEMERESNFFNIDKLILSMIGDIIENADMHGLESLRSSEFGTSRQIDIAIESIWFDLLLPLALTGVEMFVPCVTGNHDRNGMKSTYQKPGEENYTFVIYRALERMAKLSGLKNVTFDICLGHFTHVEVYGNVIVYEHGHELRNTNRDTMFNLMSKRQTQLGRVVHFYRVGHFHEGIQYGQGRAMVNGSVPGQDDYAEGKGFCSEAIQFLNFYVETKKRKTSFYKSFPIYLQNKN